MLGSTKHQNNSAWQTSAAGCFSLHLKQYTKQGLEAYNPL